MKRDFRSNVFKQTYGRCQGGFAIITVVAMMALVAACFVVLAEVFTYQLKLTHTTIARLQVDLLLNAGTHCVIADLADGTVPKKPWSVALPMALAQKGGRLTIRARRQSVNKIFFTVHARFSGLRGLRLLEFQQHVKHWRLLQVIIPGSSFGGRSFNR